MTPKKSEVWPQKFLDALAKCGNVTSAAAAAHVTRQAAYELQKRDENFAVLWADAIEAAGDVLEQEAWRRAHDGTTKPVYQGGVRVGEVKEYSDTLMIFLLKGAKPQKYKDRQEVSGPNNGPVAVKYTVEDLRRMDPSELVRLHSETLGDQKPDR